ncbi:succinate dehydrogenase assembly factor 2 family protein [Pseudoalteromonas sp. JC28]|uniref:FAD assembly factor SdhE n=1 Tax=Pseudoalteromonas sp. JC28 TaxID=2267617 RepID=UPI00157210B2|nr:succinate dehydrogenase assembly factor 2 [Pseudoalteromonas sp. JC28]NSY34572.1 succinate dehydrogenase assembly factor 2 family protein [Pseudoalteromonas sp. JC28]
MVELLPKARVKWACRRGMLELDVILESFVEQAYDALSDEGKYVFQRLVTCEDPDLFAWFMGHEECPDPELKRMVKLILDRIRV